MRGDFSRIRFNKGSQFTEVLEQQGRVALDADANEQSAIVRHLRDTAIDDIVGPFGAPDDDAGFAITVTVANNTIQIGTGRYYVHGILCENQNSLAYMDQPFLVLGPGDPTDSDLLTDLQGLQITSSIRVYLEVWERLVTALDVPCLREPALGLADTTVRRQTVWRVVAELQNVHSIDPGFIVGSADCCNEMYNPPADNSTPGKLSAKTTGASADCSCEPTPAAGYRGLENQLYRVEIHQGGDETQATFKWSRENGSVVVGVNSASGSILYADSLGPDPNLGFAANNWVEFSDDTNLFGIEPNQPGELLQIVAPTPEQLSLALAQPAPSVDSSRHPQLRRWDQSGPSAAANGIPLSAGTWLDLENGIQVQFQAGSYTPGDYWLIPARTATGNIEWPPCGSDGLPFQRPHQTLVHRAPLACIHWDALGKTFNVEDCRRIFWPLATDALHVTKISWTNDSSMTLQSPDLALSVTLDQIPDSPLEAATFIVTLEIPYVTEMTSFDPLSFPRQVVILEGTCRLIGNQLEWRYRGIVTLLAFRNWLDLAKAGIFARARVRLLGRAIWKALGTRQIFLDGQCFGVAGTSQSPQSIDLTFPSGSSARASDFESWLYLMPPPDLSLDVTPASITLVPGQPLPLPNPPTAAVSFSYPAPAGTTVYLWLTPQDGVASIPATYTVTGSPATSFTVPITINQAKAGGATVNYQVNASLSPPSTATKVVQAPFTVIELSIFSIMWPEERAQTSLELNPSDPNFPTVQATVTFNSPAPVGTNVYLWFTSKDDPNISFVTIASPVVVGGSPAQSVSATASVTANPGNTQVHYLLNASLNSKKLASDATPATLILSGFAVIQ